MSHGKTEHIVHGVEFKKLLDEGDLTHEDAAIVFGVTAKTIRQWLRIGPDGTAAHFIGYLLAMNVPARHVGQTLALALSSLRRSSTKAGDRAKLLSKSRGTNQVEEVNVSDRVVEFLFRAPDGTEAEIMVGIGCFATVADLQGILDSFMDLETIERKGDRYSLSPFGRLKYADRRRG